MMASADQGVPMGPVDGVSEAMRHEFVAVIEAAYRISEDVGAEVGAILREGRRSPLGPEETVRLLTKVIIALRDGAARREDSAALRSLAGDVEILVERLVQPRDSNVGLSDGNVSGTAGLLSKNGVEAGPVRPTPVFHGRMVPMNCGFVKTTDIDLWEGNLRLDIHLAQFRHARGREPTSEELLDIMLSRLPLPGLATDDQFEIVELARSIAVNGVQRPPILDVGGTLLDGNRRVAACHYILHRDEFSSDEKRRAEYVFVWQLTEHATPDDRDAVIVALNFEPAYKQDWPEYVKARKLHDEWEAMLIIEPTPPGPKRLAEMKRELSKKYALGPETTVVNRYLKMVEWANEFEDYHITERMLDPYEVKHKANAYFQYFDELAKGMKPGGVAYSLGQDDAFKRLVFDLLFDGKFKNWTEIRHLKHIAANEEARDLLTRARHEEDRDAAQDLVDDAVTVARIRPAEYREMGANTRIESFVEWIEQLPVRAFRDQISAENLRRLLSALKLVGKYAKASLSNRGE